MADMTVQTRLMNSVVVRRWYIIAPANSFYLCHFYMKKHLLYYVDYI